MAKKVTPQDVIESNLRRVTMYKRLFGTEDGKRVIADLEERFSNEDLFVRGDSHGTTYNVGLHDAVRYIKASIKDGVKSDSELGEEIQDA